MRGILASLIIVALLALSMTLVGQVRFRSIPNCLVAHAALGVWVSYDHGLLYGASMDPVCDLQHYVERSSAPAYVTTSNSAVSYPYPGAP